MPDDRHVVVRVEVATAVDVLEPDTAPTNQVQRGRVRERRQRGAEHLGATSDELGGRRWVGRRPEAPGRLVEAELGELLEHAPRVAIPALDVPRVLGEPLHAPRRDRDGQGDARAERVADQRALDRLERRDRRVPVEQGGGRTEQLVALADRQHRVEGRDRVGEQRRVRHVAEVHDARDAPVVVEERVVEREVAVHHLRAQPRPARQHSFLESVEHPANERPSIVILDRRGHGSERQAVLDVPEQHPVGGGVEEPPQRPAEPRERLAVGPQRSVVEVDAVGRAAPRHERRHAHHVTRATFLVTHGGDVDIGVAFRREGRRDRQRRVDPQRVSRGPDLHVEHVGPFPGVGDLEDASLAVVRRAAGSSGRARSRTDARPRRRTRRSRGRAWALRHRRTAGGRP